MIYSCSNCLNYNDKEMCRYIKLFKYYLSVGDAIKAENLRLSRNPKQLRSFCHIDPKRDISLGKICEDFESIKGKYDRDRNL